MSSAGERRFDFFKRSAELLMLTLQHESGLVIVRALAFVNHHRAALVARMMYDTEYTRKWSVMIESQETAPSIDPWNDVSYTRVPALPHFLG